MPEILPAILEVSFDEIESKLALVVGRAPIVQLDILDGFYTSNISWPYHKTGKPIDFAFRDILEGKRDGMPFWKELDFELDLMVANPVHMMEDWLALAPKRVIVHLGALKDPVETLTSLQYLRPDIEIGLALRREHGPEAIAELLPLIDCVQVMGIAVIGAQGLPFDETCLEQIAAIHAAYPELVISIDGGVSVHTIKELSEAGASRFIAGSSVFGHGEVTENLRVLKGALK